MREEFNSFRYKQQQRLQQIKEKRGMKDDWTTYDTTTGKVVKDTPLVIVRKGKRKINPIFKDIEKENPELYDKIEKMMTCYYYHCGKEYDECSKGLEGTPCDPSNCVAWRSCKEKEV